VFLSCAYGMLSEFFKGFGACIESRFMLLLFRYKKYFVLFPFYSFNAKKLSGDPFEKQN
jgi:hypothetical protein